MMKNLKLARKEVDEIVDELTGLISSNAHPAEIRDASVRLIKAQAYLNEEFYLMISELEAKQDPKPYSYSDFN